MSRKSRFEFRLNRGYGSRKDRVHIFDKEYGYFICSGFIKDGVIYTNINITKAVLVRKFGGRNEHCRNLQEVSQTPFIKET
jgi:hypothetical protein